MLDYAPEMQEALSKSLAESVSKQIQFGEELRALRGTRRAEAVAQGAGMSLWAYYRFERGGRRNINPSEILALARGLEVSPQVIMRLAQGAY